MGMNREIIRIPREMSERLDRLVSSLEACHLVTFSRAAVVRALLAKALAAGVTLAELQTGIAPPGPPRSQGRRSR